MDEIEIKTRDGVADCYAFSPEDANKNLPPVIFYMDVMGVRDSLFEMARRIADQGYYVLVPNLYYRKERKLSFPPATVKEEGPKRNEMFQLLQSLDMEMVMSDTSAYLDFLLVKDNTADKAATVGYCMGGPYSLGAAGTFPDKIAASASFHGARLATQKDDSPHLLAPKMKAKIYVGIAGIDPHFSDEEKERLEQILKENNVDYTMKVYPDVKHGFTVLDSPAYNKEGSEEHFKALFNLLEKSF
ncbi:MAG TPA: dienelactone hydrolase family protein [Balneolales bacterium]|nr:dienelactone hydrolase family protein [Balneolales bacterium]